MALESFDHEKRNNYTIPIVIRDVGSIPLRSATVALYVHIEDVNEHPMASASTLHIIVYNYNNFIAGLFLVNQLLIVKILVFKVKIFRFFVYNFSVIRGIF